MDGTSQDMSQSYMAIRNSASCTQNVAIISDEAKLRDELRRPFDLSTEFLVRWIIHQHLATGHDGLSMSSDGMAAMVLKPLETARTAGGRIYATIEGHIIGTDGVVDKIGFTVPRQAKVVHEAIVDSSVNPQVIRYVEMHGSGTSIGDALEVQGLERAFVESETAFAGNNNTNVSSKPSSKTSTRSSSGTASASRSPSSSTSQASSAARKLLVGSNRGNFGNSEAASGMMSLIKAALAVHRGTVPPMRQLGDVNDLIDLRKTRVLPRAAT
ncbi:hypothetical protein ACO1O0_002463 [Amphichorda felina]